MTPDIALLIITDGRIECLRETVKSALEQIPSERLGRYYMIDDSGDHAYRVELIREFGALFDISFPGAGIASGQRKGFCGAIQFAWETVALANEFSSADERIDYVFHLEDDFTFNERVDLDGMAAILESSPNVAQVALKRQPWGPAEERAGGFMQQWPDSYIDLTAPDGLRWCEHRNFWTTNPALYRFSLTQEIAWPGPPGCEVAFADLCRKAGYVFGYYGHRDDAPRVTHIGAERKGVGY